MYRPETIALARHIIGDMLTDEENRMGYRARIACVLMDARESGEQLDVTDPEARNKLADQILDSLFKDSSLHSRGKLEFVDDRPELVKAAEHLYKALEDEGLRFLTDDSRRGELARVRTLIDYLDGHPKAD